MKLILPKKVLTVPVKRNQFLLCRNNIFASCDSVWHRIFWFSFELHLKSCLSKSHFFFFFLHITVLHSYSYFSGMLLVSIITVNILRACLSHIKQYNVYTTDLLFNVLASITSLHIISYSHDSSVSR